MPSVVLDILIHPRGFIFPRFRINPSAGESHSQTLALSLSTSSLKDSHHAHTAAAEITQRRIKTTAAVPGEKTSCSDTGSESSWSLYLAQFQSRFRNRSHQFTALHVLSITPD